MSLWDADLSFDRGYSITAYVALKMALNSVHSEALWDNMCPWDSCKDYGLDWNWVLWNVGDISDIFLVNSGLRWVCSFSITFQHLRGLDIRQSYWSKSLKCSCWQHRHWPCFCLQCCTFLRSGWRFSPEVLHEEVKPQGLNISLNQNQGWVIWRRAR